MSNTRKVVTLKDGTVVPALGQGTWFMGEHKEKRAAEIEALRTGIENGLTLIDTAEMYGNGKSESLIGEAIKPYNRKDLFIVSKVYPHNAGKKNMEHSCDASLQRLGTDYLDMYLLHWMGNISLQETVDCLEMLVKKGKIRRWGVSNLDTSDMKDLHSCNNGEKCQVNQVLYNMGSRGIEFDLLPYMEKTETALMAYCPLAQGGELNNDILRDSVIKELAASKGATTAQIALAFAMRNGNSIAIPKTGSKEHVLDNVKAMNLELTEEDMSIINKRYPKPNRKMYLDMI